MRDFALVSGLQQCLAERRPEMPSNNNQGGGSNRGFASMDKEKQREISRKGGESVPAEKRSFSQNRGLASEAGRKGGKASHGGGKSGGATPASEGERREPPAEGGEPQERGEPRDDEE
jgi:hypothetical protein